MALTLDTMNKIVPAMRFVWLGGTAFRNLVVLTGCMSAIVRTLPAALQKNDVNVVRYPKPEAPKRKKAAE